AGPLNKGSAQRCTTGEDCRLRTMTEGPSNTENTIIEFSAVNKSYGALHVLKDIDFSVKSGEVVVICGPSGCGKSTLIRCINALTPYNSGKLIVDGRDLSDASVDVNHLRAEVGMVFQQFNLYPHLSVLENITLAPRLVKKIDKSEAEETARKLLDQV